MLWLTCSRWVVQFSALLVFFIAMKYVSVEEYGAFSVIVSFIVLNEIVSRECIENFVVSTKFLNSKKIEVVCLIFGCISACICLALSALFIDSIGLYSYEFLFVFLTVISQWSGAFARGVLLKNLQGKKIAISSSVSSLLSSIISVVLIVAGYGIMALIVQQFVLWFIGTLIFRYLSINYVLSDSAYTQSSLSAHIKHSLPSALFNVLTNRLDVLAISAVLGNHDVGVYSFVKRIYQIIQDLFSGGLERLLLSRQSHNEKKKMAVAAIRYRSLLSYIVFPMFFGMAILAPYVLPVMFDDKWHASYQLFYIMALGSVFASLISLEKSNYYSSGMIRQLLVVRCFDFLLTASLLYIFTRESLAFVAFAYTIRFIVLFLVLFFTYSYFVGGRTNYCRELFESIYPIFAGFLAIYFTYYLLDFYSAVNSILLCFFILVLISNYIILNLLINRFFLRLGGKCEK